VNKGYKMKKIDFGDNYEKREIVYFRVTLKDYCPIILILGIIVVLLIYIVFGSQQSNSDRVFIYPNFNINLIKNLSCKCFNDSQCNNHGKCWFGKCICDKNYGGQFCDQNMCEELLNPDCEFDSNCGNGSCWFGKCICPTDYSGNNCQFRRMRMSYCYPGDTMPCGNGLCILNSNNNGECYCPVENNNCTCLNYS
jgi:hypothetical protein